MAELPPILITGANGHLGRRLLEALLPQRRVIAAVRSARAERQVLDACGAQAGLETVIVDPQRAHDLAPLVARCHQAVHLIGTIRATASNPLADSHGRPADALIAAAGAAGLDRIVYVSILGAAAGSASACLRARAAVENALLAAPPAATILRVPMVLGEGDRASRALARRARAARPVLFRAGSLEQPIYAGDVIAAIVRSLDDSPAGDATFELAGPESLTRRALVLRAAALLGREPRVVSLPLACGMLFAWWVERMRKEPPLTRDMLRILDHDDAIDSSAAAARLGITLTPLDTMLARCLGLAVDAVTQEDA